jgi:hypothetical protein
MNDLFDPSTPEPPGTADAGAGPAAERMELEIEPTNDARPT